MNENACGPVNVECQPRAERMLDPAAVRCLFKMATRRYRVQTGIGQAPRCGATTVANDGGPVRCDRPAGHDGGHEADFSGPGHRVGDLVARWARTGIECPACHRDVVEIEDHHGWCTEALRQIADGAT